MTELDWWDERDVTLSPSQTEVNETETGLNIADIKARISYLPSQYTSNRGILDRSKTLWASWSIDAGAVKSTSPETQGTGLSRTFQTAQTTTALNTTTSLSV